jgi:hypothetical protein
MSPHEDSETTWLREKGPVHASVSTLRRPLLCRTTLAMLVIALAACGPAVQVASPVNPRGSALPTQSSCTPTDQDQYVYRPARLQLIAACIRITGTIVSSAAEADGDVHISVRLDPEYQALLTEANLNEGGTLTVEPVCVFPPLQAEAIRVCASDSDPLPGGLPAVGGHVFMEGRYVLDLQHHASAELHPLYRWGTLPP